MQETIRSAIDSNIVIDQDNWAVAIMRKPQGENSEHAFLMVEGVTKFDEIEKIIFKRYDLFTDEKSKENKAQIYMKDPVHADINQAKTVLLEDILKGDEVYTIVWSLKKEQAKALHEDIAKDKQNPPTYHVSGNKSLVAKSSSQEGHSCFTWAREKLHNLNDERIQLPEKYSDFVGAKTSFYIKGNPEPKSGNCLLF